MEELLELKALLLKGDIKGSLAIVEELEDMSKNGIISTSSKYSCKNKLLKKRLG